MKETLAQLTGGIAHLFYPRLCEGCSKPLLHAEEVLCLSCNGQMPFTGYHDIAENDTTLRFAGRVPFIRATSLAYFTNDGLLQHLLHRLKYQGRKEIGYYLGKLLGQGLLKTAWTPAIDIIIPVPLHKTKKALRGYNQSMLIAEGIGSVLGVPTADNLLLRVRETESQTRKTREERISNMQQAFKVAGGATLAGKHILLCDDVLTTGATIEACSQALLHEKDIKISIATIGIAAS